MGVLRQTVVVIAVVFLVSVASVTVADVTVTAQTDTVDGEVEGEGGAETAIEIADADDLRSVSQDLEADYVLVDDIDLTDEEFVPLGGDSDSFEGSFDGDGHVVMGLTVDRPDDGIGLFSRIGENGTVVGLGVEDADVTGNAFVGVIAGTNEGSIENSYATGDVGAEGVVGGVVGANTRTGNVSASHASVDGVGLLSAGGLVGFNSGDLTTSYADGNVVGDEKTGGLVGENADTGVVSESYAEGEVTAVGELTRAGGLVGLNEGEVEDTYAHGDVTGENGVGGLVGVNWFTGVVRTSYATGAVEEETPRLSPQPELVAGGEPAEDIEDTEEQEPEGSVGGLVGSSHGEVVGAYWNTESTGWDVSAGGTALTEDEMTGETARDSMDAFDFEETWTTTEGYPVLSWETAGTPSDAEDGDEDTEEPLSGFGLLVAVVAVLLSVVVAVSRRRD